MLMYAPIHHFAQWTAGSSVVVKIWSNRSVLFCGDSCDTPLHLFYSCTVFHQTRFIGQEFASHRNLWFWNKKKSTDSMLNYHWYVYLKITDSPCASSVDSISALVSMWFCYLLQPWITNHQSILQHLLLFLGFSGYPDVVSIVGMVFGIYHLAVGEIRISLQRSRCLF